MTPVPGPAPVAPALPIAGLLAQAVQPGLAAGTAATGGPIDPVSLSPAARVQQALDAPGVAMQQLGSLLREFEQISQLTSRAAPLALGELAAEIGAAASEVGAGVQALLPPPDTVQTPVQLAAAAASRVLGTLAPAPGHGAPLAGSTGEADPPADGAGPDHEALPADPGREAQAAARAMLRSAADALGRMQPGPDAAAAPAATVHLGAPGPGYGAAWCEAQIALAQAQVARASRVIETPFRVGPSWRRSAALLEQHGVRAARTSGRHGLLARIGALLVLLCLATAALCMASRLDLSLARAAAAILLALAGLAWAWRRSASWRRPRLRIALRR